MVCTFDLGVARAVLAKVSVLSTAVIEAEKGRLSICDVNRPLDGCDISLAGERFTDERAVVCEFENAKPKSKSDLTAGLSFI